MFNWLWKRIANHVESKPDIVADVLAKKLEQMDTTEVTDALAKNPYFAAEVGQAIVGNLDMSLLASSISTSEIADNLDLNELSEVIDYNQVVNSLDYTAISSHINVADLVKHIDLGYVSGMVADLVSLDNLADKIDYRKLAMALVQVNKEFFN
jgi:hypothetical protein